MLGPLIFAFGPCHKAFDLSRQSHDCGLVSCGLCDDSRLTELTEYRLIDLTVRSKLGVPCLPTARKIRIAAITSSILRVESIWHGKIFFEGWVFKHTLRKKKSTDQFFFGTVIVNTDHDEVAEKNPNFLLHKF